ncbi:MAG TPA: hypothetical protein VI112_05700 [Bacteroidia bacterium]
MKRILFIFLLLLIAATVVWYCSPYRTLIPGLRSHNYTYAGYMKEMDSVNMERNALLKKMRDHISDADAKSEVLKEAGKKFGEGLNARLFNYWYETDWDYNGTSEKPGEGSIACGYFVTTLLRDMGVKLDRSGLAQCASEGMIKRLVSAKYIHRFSNYSITDYVKEIKKLGDGTYLTGLDNHTGFTVCDKGKVYFVHSGGGSPARVLKEDALTCGLLSASHYRVVGKITDDPVFLTKWLEGEKFE